MYKNTDSSIFEQIYWLNLSDFQLMQSDFFQCMSINYQTFYIREIQKNYKKL